MILMKCALMRGKERANEGWWYWCRAGCSRMRTRYYEAQRGGRAVEVGGVYQAFFFFSFSSIQWTQGQMVFSLKKLQSEMRIRSRLAGRGRPIRRTRLVLLLTGQLK